MHLRNSVACMFWKHLTLFPLSEGTCLVTGDLTVLQRPHGDFSTQGAFEASPFQEATASGFTGLGLQRPPPCGWVSVGGWRGGSKSAPKKEKQSWGCRPCYTGLRLLGGLSGIWGGSNLSQEHPRYSTGMRGLPTSTRSPPFRVMLLPLQTSIA